MKQDISSFKKVHIFALWVDGQGDNDLIEVLGDSEGMAHDSWNMNHPEIENSYDPEIKKFSVYKI